MSEFDKLDLLGVSALAIAAATLLAAWTIASNSLVPRQDSLAARETPVSVAQDGRMHLTVAAPHPGSAPVVATKTLSIMPRRTSL